MKAEAAFLDLLTAAEIDRINALGAMLAEGLGGAMQSHRLPSCATHVGSLVHLHLGRTEPPHRFEDVDLRHPLLAELHPAALQESYLHARRGMLYTSTAMDEAIVQDSVARFTAAVRRVVG